MFFWILENVYFRLKIIELKRKHKHIFIFLIKFFATYFVLFAIYSSYLNTSQKTYPNFQCAGITQLVAFQTEQLANFLGYPVSIENHTKELSVKLLVNNVYTARVIEGCNSIGVIVLFVAFVVAFSGSFWTTLLFCLAGSILIYAINVVRIVILTLSLYYYPQQRSLLHSLIFPLIIYGLVFILWMIWVNYFSNSKKINHVEKN